MTPDLALSQPGCLKHVGHLHLPLMVVSSQARSVAVWESLRFVRDRPASPSSPRRAPDRAWQAKGDAPVRCVGHVPLSG
jgi:hypothetical protein